MKKIVLKEGQTVFDIEGNEYILEKGDTLIESKIAEAKFDFHSWDAKNRFDRQSFSVLLAHGRITQFYEMTRNAIEFDRAKYNRMDAAEQKAYEAKLNQKKVFYAFSIDGEKSFWDIPEGAYLYAIAHPNGKDVPVKEVSYYTHY